jgi:hypothetical protein
MRGSAPCRFRGAPHLGRNETGFRDLRPLRVLDATPGRITLSDMSRTRSSVICSKSCLVLKRGRLQHMDVVALGRYCPLQLRVIANRGVRSDEASAHAHSRGRSHCRRRARGPRPIYELRRPGLPAAPDAAWTRYPGAFGFGQRPGLWHHRSARRHRHHRTLEPALPASAASAAPTAAGFLSAGRGAGNADTTAFVRGWWRRWWWCRRRWWRRRR